MMEYMQDYGVNADITDIAFYDHEQVAMHGIDLNVDPSELWATILGRRTDHLFSL